jgi:hypothetical protein
MIQPPDSGNSSGAREIAPGLNVTGLPKLFTVYVDPSSGNPVIQFEDQCPEALRGMMRMAMGAMS